MLVENFLGIFTGANGGCYCVNQNSIENIWLTQPVRNDDFIISVYCSSKNGVVFLENLKACEIENLTNFQIFNQKYRDSLGHYQALNWIYSNVKGFPNMISIILFRLFLWFSPLLSLFYLFSFFPIITFITILIFLIFHKTRRLLIRLLSLYTGFFVGMIKAPKTSWIPIR
jgi:hypothetical protein